MKEVGELIRSAREKKGLTQTETGRILRLSEQYLSKMELGNCSIPTKQAKRFQKLFNIKTTELMNAYLSDYWQKLAVDLKKTK